MEFRIPEEFRWDKWFHQFNGKQKQSGLNLQKQVLRMQKTIKGMDHQLISPFTLSSASKVWQEGKRGPNIAFSIPPGLTCPGHTPTCGKDCYACKAMFIHKNVQRLQLRNLVRFRFFEELYENPYRFFPFQFFESSQSVLEHLVYEMVSLLLSSSQIPIFRLHSAGDFFSQFYCEVWAIAIEQAQQHRPSLQVTAYTRSFELNFTSLLKAGLRLYASQDEDNWNEAQAFADLYGIPTAIGPVGEGFEYDPDTHFVCPATDGTYESHVNACRQCGLCYGVKQQYRDTKEYGRIWLNRFPSLECKKGPIFIKH